MLPRRDAQRVAEDTAAAVRRGAEPDDLRPESDEAVVAVMRDVAESDVDGHGVFFEMRERQPSTRANPGQHAKPLRGNPFAGALHSRPRRTAT